MAPTPIVPTLEPVGVALLERYKARIEADCAERGVLYPWWIPTYSSMASAGLAIAAVAQRDGFASPLLLLGGLLAIVPQLVWLGAARFLPIFAEAGVVLAGALLLIVDKQVTPDFAPFLLVISAAESAAMCTVRGALAVATIDIGALIGTAAAGLLSGSALYIVGVLLATDAGIALRWQMRAIAEERAKQEVAGQQAVLAERQRLAREVHDVVGHSLSITLLHLAGARRALEEDDLADVKDALLQAEQVGRAAMADLRGSVSSIGGTGAGTQPLPGAADIAGLVEAARTAGLDVRYEQRGPIERVSPATGLGLYRIAQESLANIAKHAPGTAAALCLDCADGAVRFTVRNRLPAGHRPEPPHGSGIPGMTARATQLGAAFRAGAEDGHWVVDVRLDG